MAPSQDTQLEKVLDEVLKSGDVRVLDGFLQRDIYGGTPMKCSKQFLSKLDELVCRSLDQKDSRSARLGLAIVCKCGENLKLPDENQGLSGLIGQGLIKKWFEKCRKLWIQCGPKWDELLFSLSEDFFDVLMVVHEACKEGTYQITESFLYAVGQLGVDPRIYILIQREAIRKFNLILDKIPVELKKERKILTSQKASGIMIKLAGQILEGGDYDLQTALMEALCRMATPTQRKAFADRWFSMEHVANAFVKICDLEFETDCRKFLNLVNGMQGDRRRVYSYPCLEVYLDKYELLMPIDEKLEEFWIDFNLGSNSISFYFSMPDEDTQGRWETICIHENEVQSYTVTEEGKMKILQLKLSEVVVVGAVEGSNLAIHFSSSLDILQATRSVFGHSRNKGFERKTSTSVVKTTVKVVVEENCTQVVPESQVSLGDSEKNPAPYLLSASSAPRQKVTPAKMRISESATVIRNSARGSVHDASFLSAFKPSNAPAKSKGKPSLEMVRSCDRKGEFCVEDQRATAKIPSSGTTLKSTKAGSILEKSGSSISCSLFESNVSLQSLAFKQTNKTKADKYEKKIPGLKAVDTVPAGQGEEQSLECNFVPDTQPRPVKNISANWNKLSVSEMLTMPTQEIKTRPEPHSNLAQQQKDPALPLSVPSSDPVSLKQLHTELTQQLQQVITENNQGHTPRKPAATQRKLSGVREGLEGKSSADQRVSTLCTPKVQQAQSKSSVRGKSKCRMAQEADVGPNKAPIKGPMTKALQEKIPLNIKAETKRPPSSKDKKDAVVTGSMMKAIASHYELKTRSAVDATHQSWVPPVINRQIFNMSCFSATKRNVSHTSASLTKTHNNKTSKPSRQRKDIFAFTSESPLITGGKNKPLINTSAISSNDIHDSSGLHSTSKKGQSVANKKTRAPQISQNKEKQHVKKHLFSDTDMDCATSEVSWLRESSRKPKPVTKYSRPAPKPKAVTTNTSYESLDSPPPPSPKHVKGKTRLNKKNHNMKGRVEQPKNTVKPAAAAPNGQHAAGVRPKRAAALSTKTYKEPDSHDSQSESEKLPTPKTGRLEITKKAHEASHPMKKKTESNQPTKRHVKPERNLQSSESESEQSSTSKQQRPENILQESLKSNKKNVVSVREQTNALKDSWAARQTLLCPSPPFIDKMRSAQRSAPTLDLICSPLLTPRGSPLPASPDPACQDTPSPILLLPKPRSTGSSEGDFKPSSLYSAQKKPSSSKTRSVHSVPSFSSLRGQTSALQPPIGMTATEISPVQQYPSPAPPSPLSLSLPLLASTLLDLDKQSMPSPTQSPFPENHDCCYGYTTVSSVSQVSLSQSSTKSSVLSCRVKDGYKTTLTVSCKTEKTPPSDREIKSSQLDTSGPSRKRRISSTSNSDEDEKEERKKSKMRRDHSPRMKPRKLFKSFTEVSAAGEVSQVMSPTHTVTSGEMDDDLELPELALNQSSMYQQFSTDLKKKFQNRNQMMEIYNKQSLVTVQQHVSSLNMQVTKYRTQKLSRIQKVLLEEINRLEQDDIALKRMEKDLTIHWKKQTVAFRSYWEQQTMRDETLKKALQSNVCHSLEYEKKIFTSQMCLIRKDMKSVQDRLLGEMQEGEIQSVKRGLHSLFFPDGARF